MSWGHPRLPSQESGVPSSPISRVLTLYCRTTEFGAVTHVRRDVRVLEVRQAIAFAQMRRGVYTL